MDAQAEDVLGQFAEERRVLLVAAEVLRAQVIQVGAVRQRVLGDDINVAPVKFLVLLRLAIMRDKTFAENDVSRAETARVRAAKKNGVTRHLRINELGLGRVFHQFRPADIIVTQFAILSMKGGVNMSWPNQ